MTAYTIHTLVGISPFRKCLFLAVFSFLMISSTAQFAPVVGFPGTTAIAGDSSAFIGWATGCTIYRGYRDIAVPDSGYASDGDYTSALGPAGQNGTVSLGDSGIAILTFDKPIINGPGFDFAVFENGFDVGPPSEGLAFLELAFVEVSSDGVRYVRFPAMDNVQDTVQLHLDAMDGSMLNNLAGKYIFDYGTPFDLAELADSAGLDISNITHVKIIDVIGTIDPAYATRDSRGRMINDPYPTNYASSGFDLDAVGVINQQSAAGITDISTAAIYVYPNPTTDAINILTGQTGNSIVQVSDVSGKLIVESSFMGKIRLSLSAFLAGTYIVKVVNQGFTYSKLIVKE